ncbi:hypothetical protein ACH5RR_003028 [Cinchona calisaya]|uniref:Reverse transcriptase domain-containing protein n=1 Tax=Cinchona calisaya TaxID=153742 RepID=A0ABD3AUB1_9GENT
MPSSITHFRPVALCSTLYKIISTTRANRLKPILKHCISENQSVFIVDRQIFYNVIVAHEYLHYLKNRRHGKIGFLTLKLDMAKEYDRVEWSFLTATLENFGFCPTWINWISKCISSVSYSFNLNGENVGFLRPSRGIRQRILYPLTSSFCVLRVYLVSLTMPID